MLATLALGFTLALTPQNLDRDARMKWWREARYGMFIHWGLYSIPAGEWNGTNYPGASEWLQTTAKIKPADYEKLQPQFNPDKFDAHAWVKLAKDSGMKYIVITSKHHDGFAMWPSKQGTWNIGNTPFKRDVLKELATECKKQGLRMCFYHSIMDWHHPDYLPRREWDDRDASQADFDKYVAYMKAQLKELLNGDYGDIGILWFDGEWEGTWTHERGKDLYDFVRSLQPNIIVNNRVDKGRGGMGGMSDAKFAGDYGTPEQEIPANGLPGIDWETCMTMNNSWGYHKNDHDFKNETTILTNLIDVASKGGNYLLNVGPTSEGLIPKESQDVLLHVGGWLRKNGEAIYGTKAGPFPRPLEWGRVTQKPGKLYLMVFDNKSKRVELPGLKADIVKAYPLLGGSPVPVVRNASGFEVDLPASREEVPVYVVEVKGSVSAEVVPLTPGREHLEYLLSAKNATVFGDTARYEGGEKDAIGYWTDVRDRVIWDILAPKTEFAYSVTIEYACEPGSEGSEFQVSVSSSSVKGKVAATKSWTDFRTVNLGTIRIPEGHRQVTVRALTKPGNAVMNLRSISLYPELRPKVD
jgi:alpha-L-fucosidase